MSKVYGQSPSAANSATKRYDEFAGSVTQQDNNLDRKQDVAQLGETLPIVFCWREKGDGGVWISPRLVGLGFKGNYIHLAYVISEGQIGEISADEIWFGKRHAKFQFLPLEVGVGYEEVPDVIEIVNQPGRIIQFENFDFYAEDPQVTYFNSATATCTGMEFIMHSYTNLPYVLDVEVLDVNDGYRVVKEVSLEYTGLTEVQEVLGLSPSKYQFNLYTQAVWHLKLAGRIEHYQAGDGVTPLADYDNMSILGVKAFATDIMREDNNSQIPQLHAFVRDGMFAEDARSTGAANKSTSQFANLVNYLLFYTLKLDVDLIDKSGLALICNMNEKYEMFFNGVLNTTSSYQEWVFKTAPYFWASPAQVNGKYGLTPVVPVSADGTVKTGAVQPVLTIGLDSIIEGSYNMVMESSKERQDVCCVMIYKGSITNAISETKTVEVRFKGAALEGPFETHDITGFCVDINHAIRAAMYILSRRRYVTHTLSVTLRTQTIQLNPGDIIKSNIEIEGGTKNQYYYQVDSISEGPDGLVSLALTHFPVNDQGQSLIALAITQALPDSEQPEGSSTPNSLSDFFVWQ